VAETCIAPAPPIKRKSPLRGEMRAVALRTYDAERTTLRALIGFRRRDKRIDGWMQRPKTAMRAVQSW
jgi:hypothetical protein